jgi:glucokinase
VSEAPDILGIDVGGTKALATMRHDGGDRWTCVRPTGDHTGPEALVELVAGIADEAAHVATPHAIGLGFPGLVEPSSGRVLGSVILQGWSGVALSSMVTDRTGLPCAVDNDVNNAARGEHGERCRRGRAEDLLFVAVGTGIGGALVLDGRVWGGASGHAGEVGHMSAATGLRCTCGRTGCVATTASGRALERALGTDADGLATAMARPDADDVVRRAAEDLATVVADAMSLLGLSLVVLGGGVSQHPTFVGSVQTAFAATAMPEVAAGCRVEPAAAGYVAGAIGAVELAAELVSEA